MGESPLEYQKSVLRDIVHEAVEEGVLSTDDAIELRDRITSLETLAEVDRTWNALVAEYGLLEDGIEN